MGWLVKGWKSRGGSDTNSTTITRQRTGGPALVVLPGMVHLRGGLDPCGGHPETQDV